MLNYESTGNELADRILALIPSHPEILEMDDAWGLFKVDGFSCDDLAPSLAQAQWALCNARGRANKRLQRTAERSAEAVKRGEMEAIIKREHEA